MSDQYRAQLPQLITYADRLGGTLPGLADLLDGALRDVFGGVHVLPFYTPFDGVDAGFDPQDHTAVDPRLGSWQDVQRLSRAHTVMADVIVNHMSSKAPQFRDVIEHGDASRWSGMFLTMDAVFPDGATEADLTAIYRPRPGLPFTTMTVAGRPRLLWTTFASEQVDLNIDHASTWDYLTGIIDTMTAAGVTQLRLDAVGYVGKEAGTNCFMIDKTTEFTQRLRTYAASRGARVLLEVHGHHQQQIEIARTVDWVYDFALPPLVLHAIHAQDAAPLDHWLEIRPSNTVTVLDTHDGIGTVDVGASPLRPGLPGLLSRKQITDLVDAIHRASGGSSALATGKAASNLDLYQVNCTFYDALGGDAHRYLAARLVQIFTPGIPQIYYVGLLAGHNDLELLSRTGVGREINRHYYTPVEVEAALAQPVVQALIGALRLRGTHPAFLGTFSHQRDQQRLIMNWINGADALTLEIDFTDTRVRITSIVGERVTSLSNPLMLAEFESALPPNGLATAP